MQGQNDNSSFRPYIIGLIKIAPPHFFLAFALALRILLACALTGITFAIKAGADVSQNVPWVVAHINSPGPVILGNHG